MLVSITLAGILCALAMNLWFGTHLNVSQTRKHNLDQMGIQTASMALDARIRQAATFLELQPNRLIWIEQNGSMDTLFFAHDSVWLNGRTVISSLVTSFHLQADGPIWNKDSSTQHPTWAKLDLNHDGHLDANELDANLSQSLDVHELSHAALIEMRLGFEDKSTVLIRRAIRTQSPVQ